MPVTALHTYNYITGATGGGKVTCYSVDYDLNPTLKADERTCLIPRLYLGQ